MEIQLTRELLAEGYAYAELRAEAFRGARRHVRHGVWSEPVDDERQQHVLLARAATRLLAPDSCLSHETAAVLHGLPLLGAVPRRAQVTQVRRSGGRVGTTVHARTACLGPEDRTEVAGLPVTTLARTVTDLGRSLSFGAALCVADAAVRAGLTIEEWTDCLDRARGWPGVRRSRRVAYFADGRSESPGESLSRVRLAAVGLRPSHLQYEVRDDVGRFIARADFCFEEQRTLGEFDGKVKYGALLAPGETSVDAVLQEKWREDALRDLGWQVVRWTWAELSQPDLIAQRFRRAFARTLNSTH